MKVLTPESGVAVAAQVGLVGGLPAGSTSAGRVTVVGAFGDAAALPAVVIVATTGALITRPVALARQRARLLAETHNTHGQLATCRQHTTHTVSSLHAGHHTTHTVS